MKVNTFLTLINTSQPRYEILAARRTAGNNLNKLYSQCKAKQYGELKFAG
jgi:hypothetical protein